MLFLDLAFLLFLSFRLYFPGVLIFLVIVLFGRMITFLEIGSLFFYLVNLLFLYFVCLVFNLGLICRIEGFLLIDFVDLFLFSFHLELCYWLFEF